MRHSWITKALRGLRIRPPKWASSVSVTPRTPYRSDRADKSGFTLDAKPADFSTIASVPSGEIRLVGGPASTLSITIQARRGFRPVFSCDLEVVGGGSVRVDGGVLSPGHGSHGHIEEVAERRRYIWQAEHRSDGSDRAQLELRIPGPGTLNFRGCHVSFVK